MRLELANEERPEALRKRATPFSLTASRAVRRFGRWLRVCSSGPIQIGLGAPSLPTVRARLLLDLRQAHCWFQIRVIFQSLSRLVTQFVAGFSLTSVEGFWADPDWAGCTITRKNTDLMVARLRTHALLTSSAKLIATALSPCEDDFDLRLRSHNAAASGISQRRHCGQIPHLETPSSDADGSNNQFVFFSSLDNRLHEDLLVPIEW